MRDRLHGMRLIKRIFLYKRLPLLNPTVLASDEEIAHTVFRFPVELMEICIRLKVELGRKNEIFYLSWKEHLEISRIATKFGGEML